ncbi:unnamed protein product [marine sediment metagenome]|uniref:VOC domain-containing protein n=1 Tax=marine sediment metagenome TaxID=412755 RepID=X1KG45_9ZZZZ
MNLGSPLIKIPYLHQTGIVVKNLEKTALDYWNIAGVGPWDIFTLESPHCYNMTYHGEPADFSIKVAFAQVGSYELELMQTVEGHTDYDDFIDKYGEGANHLQYWVDSVDTMILNMPVHFLCQQSDCRYQSETIDYFRAYLMTKGSKGIHCVANLDLNSPELPNSFDRQSCFVKQVVNISTQAKHRLECLIVQFSRYSFTLLFS